MGSDETAITIPGGPRVIDVFDGNGGKLLVLWARPESFFRPDGPAGAEPRPQGRSPGQGADFGPFYAPFAPKRVKFAQVTDPKTSRIAVLFHQGHRTHWGAMS